MGRGTDEDWGGGDCQPAADLVLSACASDNRPACVDTALIGAARRAGRWNVAAGLAGCFPMQPALQKCLRKVFVTLKGAADKDSAPSGMSAAAKERCYGCVLRWSLVLLFWSAMQLPVCVAVSAPFSTMS